MAWIQGKRLWITGASSGIGRALAVAVAAAGGELILSGRNEERLAETATRCRAAAPAEGRAVELLPFDVSDPEARASALSAVTETERPLHGLINNAGVSQRSLAAETNPAVYRRLYETNLQSAVELTLGVIPLLKAAGDARIAAVSSIAGELYGPMRSGYGATKAAMNAFFYSLRTELWSSGVRVTVVIPGFIRTEVSRNALTGGGAEYGAMDEIQANGMDPDRAAAQIVPAIERGKRLSRVGMTPKLWYGLAVRGIAPGLFDRVMRNAKVT